MFPFFVTVDLLRLNSSSSLPFFVLKIGSSSGGVKAVLVGFIGGAQK